MLPSRSTPPDGERPKGGGARDWGRGLREAAPFLGLGTTLAATVLVGVGAGYWLDGRLGTSPVFVLLGSVVGIAAAMYHFVRSVSGSSRHKTDQQQ